MFNKQTKKVRIQRGSPKVIRNTKESKNDCLTQHIIQQ